MNNWKTSDASRPISLAGCVFSRALVLLILTVIFGTAAVSGQETPRQSIEFRWKLIKVGAMDFEIGPAFFAKSAANAGEFGQPLFADDEAALSASVDGRAPVHLAVTGIANGPLKWVKNYQARAELSVQGQSRTFVLAGEDNGVREKRALVFEAGLPPVVKSFIDSTAPEALNVQNAWKHDTVDPLTVFEWMIFSAVKGQSCAKKFWIYDGKRRYAAQTTALAAQPVEIILEESRGGSCRLTLIGSAANADQDQFASLQSLGAESDAVGVNADFEIAESGVSDDGSTKAKAGWGAFWPFGKGDRHIDFDFRICSNQSVIVERIAMGTPIGKVVAASKRQC